MSDVSWGEWGGGGCGGGEWEIIVVMREKSVD